MPDMSVMHGLNLSSDVQEQAARTPWLTQDMVQRFMDACRGDEHKALQRIKATVVRVCGGGGRLASQPCVVWDGMTDTTTVYGNSVYGDSVYGNSLYGDSVYGDSV